MVWAKVLQQTSLKSPTVWDRNYIFPGIEDVVFFPNGHRHLHLYGTGRRGHSKEPQANGKSMFVRFNFKFLLIAFSCFSQIESESPRGCDLTSQSLKNRK